MKKILLALVLLTGCSSQGVNRAELNEITREFYASVKSVEPVTLSSEVGTGIVGGAAIGIIDELDGNHEDMIAGGIAGAIVGGLFTALFEGSNQAYQYTLHSELDGEFSVIQKEKIDIATGCAKVSIGHKASISSAVNDKCNAL